LIFGHELVDLNRALAFERDCFELFWTDFDVLALADFVAFDDVVAFDLITRLRIDLAILDPIAGVLIDLMKADLLSL